MLSGSRGGAVTETNEEAVLILRKAASNVRHLIAHIAGEGKAVEETDYANALSAVAKIDDLSPQEEAAFWKSYSSLVKDALPARVDALYYAEYVDAGASTATSNPEIKKIARQNALLQRIRRISVFAFTVTLLLFAYLSVSGSAMQRNQLIAEEYANLKAGVVKGTAVERMYQAVSDEKSDKQDGASVAMEGQASQPGPSTKQARLDALIEGRKKELSNLAGYNNKILRFLQFRWRSDQDKQPVQLDPIDNAVLVMQQSLNALISTYLLPVFAALLGVTVFILRTASADIKALSFRTYETGIYSNRLALGVVGGIAISWFAVTDKTGIVGSITPAALAFLVGYSVEVLYNILDSLVKALGANEKA
jgi:hypothetical protein